MLSRNYLLCYPIVYNWIGDLKLDFELRGNRTVLVKHHHFGPFFIQKPFYYEDQVPHIYLLHPPGGLVGGDQLFLQANLRMGSQVLFTTPGASKFYRSNGSYVYLKQRFNLGENSTLEWLPQSNIFFCNSKVIIDSELQVSRGARFIFFETLCFCHLSSCDVDTDGSLNIFLSIVLEDFIGLKECIKVNNSESFLRKFWKCQISAIFFAMPCDVKILNNVRNLIKLCNVQFCGATLLDNLLVVRLLDNNNELVQMVLRDLWFILRPNVIKKQPVIPRVWST